MLKILIESLVTACILIIFISFILLYILLNFKKKKRENSLKLKEIEKIIIKDYFDLAEDKNESMFEKQESFHDFVEYLKMLEESKYLKDIILDIDNLSFTITQIEELEPIFKKLREKFKVKAIATNFNNNSYRLSLLADEILMFKSLNSSMTLMSYSKKIPYYKLLFEKLGLKFNVLHIGDYKAAGENFHLDKMSDESKENTKNLLLELQNNFIDKIKERRNIDVFNEIKNGDLILINYKKALEYKLIDAVDSLSNLIDEDNSVELSSYIKKLKNKKEKSKNEIAVINLEGEIKEDTKTGISYKNVQEKLEKLYELENVKALILRINSLGGSALESEMIYQELKQLDLPIYVSMSSVCASGGYYISTVSRKVFANKTTLTGSIGVVSIYPTFDKIIDKLGINLEEISLGQGTELFDLRKELTDSLKEKIISSMKDVYFEFKLHVMRSRIMTEERLEKIAGGRVWLGTQAKENGLIDGIKTFDEVVEYVKEKLELKDYKLVFIRNTLNLNDKIKQMQSKFDLKDKMLEMFKFRNKIMMYEDFEINK